MEGVHHASDLAALRDMLRRDCIASANPAGLLDLDTRTFIQQLGQMLDAGDPAGAISAVEDILRAVLPMAFDVGIAAGTVALANEHLRKRLRLLQRTG